MADASLDYEDMMEIVVDALQEGGFRDLKVRDCHGMAEPEAINGFQPDAAAANKKGMQFVFAVETAVTLTTAEAAERFEVFATYARENAAQFILVVPEGEEGLAATVFEENNISEDNVEIWEA